MILFNMLPELKEKIHTLWDLGHVHIGTCNAKTIAYTTKYVNKQEKAPKSWLAPTFSAMSKRPPIGHSYLEKNTTYHENNQSITVRNSDGKRQRLPPFFKNKIFTKSDIEAISQRTITHSDQSARDEEKRIKKLGANPGKYQRDQEKNRERQAIKKLKNNEKL